MIPEYQGEHGHPILAGREMLEAFLRAPETSNAREVEHAHQAEIEYVPIDDPLVAVNVDTPEQYAALNLPPQLLQPQVEFASGLVPRCPQRLDITFMTVSTPHQTEFVETVLTLKPRIATFDCDGTLWSGDAGEGFFSWELEQGLVSEEIVSWARARYADYRAGKVAEEVMCGEMVTMHRGLQEEVVQQACDTYFAKCNRPQHFPGDARTGRAPACIRCGCDVWAVSSSNQWIIRSAMRYFGIPQNRILAAEVAIDNGIDHRPSDSSSQRPRQGGGDSICAQLVSRSQARLRLRQRHLGPRDASHVQASIRHQPQSGSERDRARQRLDGLSAGRERKSNRKG